MDVEDSATAEDAAVRRMALAEVSRSFEAVLEDVLQPPVAGLCAVQEHAKRTTETTVLELKKHLEEDEKLLVMRTRDLHDANISVNEMYGAGMGVLTRIESMLEDFEQRTGLLDAELESAKHPAHKVRLDMSHAGTASVGMRSVLTHAWAQLFSFAGLSPRPSRTSSLQRQVKESSSASSSSTNNVA